jgi:hypothetical protein
MIQTVLGYRARLLRLSRLSTPIRAIGPFACLHSQSPLAVERHRMVVDAGLSSERHSRYLTTADDE